ncbi:hypothetical protein [Idiomarina abyssalis]|uniref:hypothetical protein n=1 Tax=Idiomarina abyssalis TaxID=86102 RepID=UPI001CD4750E|nr:hypothetical protein [Idiomarina abyssalis]
MIFDHVKGYIQEQRYRQMPYVEVTDPITQMTKKLPYYEAFHSHNNEGMVNVPPVTEGLINGVKKSLSDSQWNLKCEKFIASSLRPVLNDHYIAATVAIDPFRYIASFAYQANQAANRVQNSEEQLTYFIGKLVTVYLLAHDYYMPDKVHPLLIEAIQNSTASNIDKKLKAIHLRLSDHILDMRMNEKPHIKEQPGSNVEYRRFITEDEATNLSSSIEQ